MKVDIVGRRLGMLRVRDKVEELRKAAEEIRAKADVTMDIAHTCSPKFKADLLRIAAQRYETASELEKCADFWVETALTFNMLKESELRKSVDMSEISLFVTRRAVNDT